MKEDKIDAVVVDLWPDAGKALGLGKNTTYKAATNGQIPTIQFGRMKKVPIWFLRQLSQGTEDDREALNRRLIDVGHVEKQAQRAAELLHNLANRLEGKS